jgi:hypothetical protein
VIGRTETSFLQLRRQGHEAQEPHAGDAGCSIGVLGYSGVKSATGRSIFQVVLGQLSELVPLSQPSYSTHASSPT